MSRERPTAAPKIVYGGERLKGKTERAERQKLEVPSGPALMGGLMARATRGRAKRMPVFIRRGYEAGIVDELRDFFTRRPRPWRPAANAPKANRKTLPRSIGRRAMHRRQA